MNVHFTGAICSEKEFDAINIKDEYKKGQAAIKFFRVLCEGFAQSGEEIKVYANRPTDKIRSGKVYLPRKHELVNGVDYTYAPQLFIAGFKHVICVLQAIFHYLLLKKSEKGDVVILDTFVVSLSIGTLLACKIRRIPVVSFITDIPTIYVFNTSKKPSFQQRLSQFLAKCADAYIFVTSAMNEVINDNNKPYLVMEGFVDSTVEQISANRDKKDCFTCLYTGGVEAIYGLDMLVDGFINADIPNSKLIIYGSGSFVGEVEEISREHSNIEYRGLKSNREIVLEQVNASLLINPRYTNAVYTRYSFPGKNLEYIVSGTPTLTTNLPGMPFEYRDYVYLIEEETVEGLSKMLRYIYSLGPDVIDEKGKRAKEWALRVKNNCYQAKIIKEFLLRLTCNSVY